MNRSTLINIFICLLGALTLCSCSQEGILKLLTGRFMESTVELPDKVIKIQNGVIEETTLPERALRLVYYYSEKECSSCCVAHSYELCNLFSQDDYLPIILFSPKESNRGEVLSLIVDANYDFPMYVAKDNEWVQHSNIPRDARFHAFMINEENKPIFVGDPVRSESSYNVFEDVLRSAVND